MTEERREALLTLLGVVVIVVVSLLLLSWTGAERTVDPVTGCRIPSDTYC